MTPEELAKFKATLSDSEAVEWDCLEQGGIDPERARDMIGATREVLAILPEGLVTDLGAAQVVTGAAVLEIRWVGGRVSLGTFPAMRVVLDVPAEPPYGGAWRPALARRLDICKQEAK